MNNREKCSQCGLYLVDGKHDFAHPTNESKNNLSREEFEQNLTTLLKAPIRKSKKLNRKKIVITQNGKEVEIKPLLKSLRIKGEIVDWVKKTVSDVDNLIFELFPNATRQIPYINENIKYQQDKNSLLCVKVRQNLLWICSEENEVTKSEPWQNNLENNLANRGFIRRLKIVGEQDYQNNRPAIEKCLLKAIANKETEREREREHTNNL